MSLYHDGVKSEAIAGGCAHSFAGSILNLIVVMVFHLQVDYSLAIFRVTMKAGVLGAFKPPVPTVVETLVEPFVVTLVATFVATLVAIQCASPSAPVTADAPAWFPEPPTPEMLS